MPSMKIAQIINTAGNPRIVNTRAFVDGFSNCNIIKQLHWKIKPKAIDNINRNDIRVKNANIKQTELMKATDNEG